MRLQINLLEDRGTPPEGNIIPGAGIWKGSFGVVIGILTGLVGLGGGYALVPGLIYHMCINIGLVPTFKGECSAQFC
jgi:uncharacterized membrane protein YfcA